MADGDPLAPASAAAAAAPIIDRLRLRIAHQIPVVAGDVLRAAGLDATTGQVLGNLRNLVPDRVTPRDHVRAAFRYWPAGQVDGALDRMVAGGVLHESEDGIAIGPPGRQLLGELRSRFEAIVADLWSKQAPTVKDVGPLVERLLAASVDTGGPSFALCWPVHEPPGTSAALLLAERLTPLRFHRADAHAAAWAAAGLTVAEVQELGPGPRRDAIEADTNERAAKPYAALSPAERFALVAGLGRLPG